MHRIKPLLDIQQEMESVKTEFDQQFSEGYFPGWPVCLVVINLRPTRGILKRKKQFSGVLFESI